MATAKRAASVMEFIRKIFRLKGHPPLYRGLVNALGLEFVTTDNKASQQLGYKPLVNISQGLNMMKK
ncbi:hypothetical protein ACWA1F_05200 [Flavobacterium sp. 3-218]